MTKIVPFTRKSDKHVGVSMTSFLDDGTLLDFSATHNGTISSLKAQEYSVAAHSDWTNQELADLFRAFNLIKAIQTSLEFDRGMSDEGAPWFLILNLQGEVLVHICRIDGEYILDSVSIGKILKARDFSSLVDNFLSRSALESNKRTEKVVQLTPGGKVYLHPSMMLAALLWTLLQYADHLETDDAGIPDLSFPHVSSVDEQSKSNEDGVLEAASGAKPELNVHSKGNELVDVNDFDKANQIHLTSFAQALTAIVIASGLYSTSDSLDVFWLPSVEELGLANVTSAGAATGNENTSVSSVQQPLVANLFSDVDGMRSSHTDTRVVTEAAEGLTVLEPANPIEVEFLGKLTNPEDISTPALGYFYREIIDQGRVLPSVDAQDEGGHEGDIAFYSPLIDQRSTNVDVVVGDPFHSFINSISESSERVVFYDAAFFSEVSEGQLGESHEIISAALVEIDDLTNASAGASVDVGGLIEKQTLKFGLFDKGAQAFVDALIQDNDIEVLVFDREIILLDKAALSGNAASHSWQFEDGSLISVIGLSSDLALFDSYA